MTYVFYYLILVTGMSAATFLAYGADKRRAGSIGQRRVPERTLHLLALLGGWPGAILAQRRFRHKTKKASFRLALWFVVLLHLTIVAGVAYLVVGALRK